MRSPTALSLAIVLLCAPAISSAIEFRTVSDEIAVLYEGPSRESRKQLILTRGYPVEVIISTDGWMRVRDETGSFGWIEESSLGTTRTVMVTGELTEARESPADTARLVFRAKRGVVLEFLELSGGWARVKHHSGLVAYIRLTDLWGV